MIMHVLNENAHDSGGKTQELLWEQLLALLVALPLFRMLRQLLGACTSSGALALFRMMRQVMRALGTTGIMMNACNEPRLT